MWWREMSSLRLINPQIMVSYLGRGWKIIEWGNVLLLTRENIILLTLHCGRYKSLSRSLEIYEVVGIAPYPMSTFAGSKAR